MTKDALESLLAEFAPDSGCSNHGCYILKPKGMATNGPCSCHRGNKVKINALKAALFDELVQALQFIERNLTYHNLANGGEGTACYVARKVIKKAKRITNVLNP